MTTCFFSRRQAATAIGTAMLTAALGTAAHAGGGFIDFDELAFDGVLTTLSPDHYLNQGVLFLEAPYIVDLSIGHPNELGQFIAGGGTANNALALATTINQLSIDLQFVLPGTMVPAVTDWVSVLVFDTNVGTQLGALEAYDIEGNLLGFTDAITDQSWVGTLSLQFEGIHRIRLITDLDGNMFDNIAFGALGAAGPGDIPGPATIVALAVGGLLRPRGRRRPA